MKALVGAFNQEKALVGTFSVIVKTDFETDEHYTELILTRGTWPPPAVSAGPARGRGGLLVAGEGDGGGEVAGPGRRAPLLQHGSIRPAEAAIFNSIPRRGNKYFYSQIFY